METEEGPPHSGNLVDQKFRENRGTIKADERLVSSFCRVDN